MERNPEAIVRRFAAGFLARSVVNGQWKNEADREAATELAQRLEMEARSFEGKEPPPASSPREEPIAPSNAVPFLAPGQVV